jgi:hypothetical protein
MDRSPPANYDHQLGCLAGFFATEAQALAARHELQVTPGLQSTRGVLLSPAQAGWLSFTRQTRALARGRNAEGWSWSDAPLMALLAGFAVALVVALWPVLGDKLGVQLGTRVYLLMPVVGAGAGWAAAVWLPFASQYRRFDRSVRRQLRAGR